MSLLRFLHKSNIVTSLATARRLSQWEGILVLWEQYSSPFVTELCSYMQLKALLYTFKDVFLKLTISVHS